jgi:hypothetical protein
VLYVNSFASAIGPTDYVGPLKHGCKSILNPRYLEQTRNADPAEARNNMAISPAALAAKAAHLALEQAAYSLDDIGLVITDTLTPLELIPSEAQRTCKELGVKVASFDINTAGVGLPLLFETVASWKEERLEKPILCISVHAPTLCFDFTRIDDTTFPCSDMAVAAVLSTRRSGFELIEAFSQEITTTDMCISVPVNGLLSISNAFLQAEEALIEELTDRIAAAEPKNVIAATAQVGKNPSLLYSCEICGPSFGAGIGVAFEQLSSSLKSGDTVAAITSGCGIRTGGFVVAKI